jgi:hypothetical protein
MYFVSSFRVCCHLFAFVAIPVCSFTFHSVLCHCGVGTPHFSLPVPLVH